MGRTGTRTKPGTDVWEETRQGAIDTEGLAATLLHAAEDKAWVVASVMNDECGPGTSGIADDFGVAVEMALKARVVFKECGPWEDSAGYREMEKAIKTRLGHKVDLILGELPHEDIETVKKLYDHCVEKHREVQLPPWPEAEVQRISNNCMLEYHGIYGPDITWVNFDSFMEWVSRATGERYHPGPPEIPLPIGGTVHRDARGGQVEIPSFAEKLINWVGEPMKDRWNARTVQETLETNLKIADARSERAGEQKGTTIRIPLRPSDAKTLRTLP